MASTLLNSYFYQNVFFLHQSLLTCGSVCYQSSRLCGFNLKWIGYTESEPFKSTEVIATDPIFFGYLGLSLHSH